MCVGVSVCLFLSVVSIVVYLVLFLGFVCVSQVLSVLFLRVFLYVSLGCHCYVCTSTSGFLSLWCCLFSSVWVFLSASGSLVSVCFVHPGAGLSVRSFPSLSHHTAFQAAST